MPTAPDPLHVCEAAARAGGRVLQEWVGRFKATAKGPRDLVTEADHASQAEVRRVVLEAFPTHGFVGEEGEGGRPPLPPGAVGHSGRGTRWIVDPLDGTSNYVHGFPAYCVSIALADGDELVVATIYDPLRDECFTARRGGGAWLTGAAIALAGVGLIGSQRLGGAALIPFALTIISAFFWGVGNVIGKKAGQVDMLSFMVWSSLAAPLPLVGLSLIFEGQAGVEAVLHPRWFAIGCALFLAYVATLFGFGVWGKLLARYPAALAAPFALLVPVFGMASAAMIFVEAVSPVEWMGAGLVLLGLGWHGLGGRRAVA
jgi:hypothetical protein